MPLRTIGGGLIGPDGKPIARSKKDTSGTGNNSNSRTCVDKDGAGSGSDELSFSDVKLGVNGPFTRTTVGRGGMGSSDGGGHGGGHGDEASDDEILDEYRRNQMRSARASDERETRITTVGPNHAGHVGDVEHGHSGGIMVTETFRVERS